MCTCPIHQLEDFPFPHFHRLVKVEKVWTLETPCGWKGISSWQSTGGHKMPRDVCEDENVWWILDFLQINKRFKSCYILRPKNGPFKHKPFWNVCISGCLTLLQDTLSVTGNPIPPLRILNDWKAYMDITTRRRPAWRLWFQASQCDSKQIYLPDSWFKSFLAFPSMCWTSKSPFWPDNMSSYKDVSYTRWRCPTSFESRHFLERSGLATFFWLVMCFFLHSPWNFQNRLLSPWIQS